ncbi:MAG: hypothetical protein SCK70_07185 [bacterium]|nr:hypothetical protein [bacterium]
MYRILLIVCIFTINIGAISSYSQTIAFQKRLSGYLTGGQATFDIYKPYASMFINLKKNVKPFIFETGNEAEIFSMLARNFTTPEFLLFQTTFYQLSALSSYLESEHTAVYHRFNTYADINLMRSVGAGYEDLRVHPFFGKLCYFNASATAAAGTAQTVWLGAGGICFQSGFPQHHR